jgi:hypothetical protein
VKRLTLCAILALARCRDRPTRYEYLVEPALLFSPSWLDSLGAEGWELVQIYQAPPVSPQVGMKPLAIFKRQVGPHRRETTQASVAGNDHVWNVWKLVIDSNTRQVAAHDSICRRLPAELSELQRSRQPWTQARYDTLVTIIATNCVDVR